MKAVQQTATLAQIDWFSGAALGWAFLEKTAFETVVFQQSRLSVITKLIESLNKDNNDQAVVFPAVVRQTFPDMIKNCKTDPSHIYPLSGDASAALNELLKDAKDKKEIEALANHCTILNVIDELERYNAKLAQLIVDEYDKTVRKTEAFIAKSFTDNVREFYSKTEKTVDHFRCKNVGDTVLKSFRDGLCKAVGPSFAVFGVTSALFALCSYVASIAIAFLCIYCYAGVEEFVGGSRRDSKVVGQQQGGVGGAGGPFILNQPIFVPVQQHQRERSPALTNSDNDASEMMVSDRGGEFELPPLQGGKMEEIEIALLPLMQEVVTPSPALTERSLSTESTVSQEARAELAAESAEGIEGAGGGLPVVGGNSRSSQEVDGNDENEELKAARSFSISSSDDSSFTSLDL